MSKIESIEFSQIEETGQPSRPILEKNLDVIKDVKVTLQVKIGEATISVNELMNLGKDSVIQLSAPITSPVDILLDGKVVARGHLVSADDNFGVQITETSS